MYKSRMLTGAVMLSTAAGFATVASAEEVERSNWMPNVGSLDFETGEQPLGDMWTFNCPRAGTVSISVDTKDDTDTQQADTDPIMFLVDGQGTLLASADDDVDCTYPPVCGFQCPAVTDVACGQGGAHSVIMRDFGTADATGTPCQEGGGYNLTVEVFVRGVQLPEQALNLNGGPRRAVPRWARNAGKAPVGPALDDEDVPFQELFGFAGADTTDAAIRSVMPENLLEK